MSTTTPEPLDPSFQISLPSFEGPLDLLLHLIRKHELDILDLPIAFVTERYLAYVSMMEQLDLDIASEYLVMAATLAHIKSKMLLPQEPEDQAEEESAEEEIDPRAELIRRLLEYQKYKDVAEQLGTRGIAGRDVFLRGSDAPEASGPTPLAPTSLFRLLDAFQGVLKRAQADVAFEITTEGLSIQDRMSELTDLLRERREVTFEMLFEGQVTIFDLVITFMALLEMAKRRLVRIYQADPHSPIHLRSTVIADEEQTELPFEGEPDAEEPAPPDSESEEADEDGAAPEASAFDASDPEWEEDYAAWDPDAEEEEPAPSAAAQPASADSAEPEADESTADSEPLAAQQPGLAEAAPVAESESSAAEAGAEPVAAAETPPFADPEPVAAPAPDEPAPEAGAAGEPDDDAEEAAAGPARENGPWDAGASTAGPSGLRDAVADAQAVAGAAPPPTGSLDPNDDSGKEPDLAASDEDEDAPT